MPSEEVERKLAAILSADAVGYSRLMAEDEAATIRTLRSYRGLITSLVEEHRGRVVDAPGDNLLAEFPTALDAVASAAEIQRVLAARNVGLPEDRRMLYRIGIHVGEVAVEGGRVYGDGVNVAARLEGLAEPGGICVSGTVHEQVRRKLEVAFADLGPQHVKNIPDAVRVYAVQLDGGSGETPSRRKTARRSARAVAGLLVAVVIGLAGWWLASPQDPGTEPGEATADSLTVPGFGAPAIAVLPFDNLSGDPEQQYFADGIAEDLLTRLSTWRNFPVIARNSSFAYRGGAVDMRQVSRELGARYIVEGSVRRAGERVRITAQLIDAPTGAHVWADRYDRELGDVFALQDEITEAIVAAMNPALLETERERALRQDPSDLGAWELVLRSQAMMLSAVVSSSRDSNAQARVLSERALELDPDFALAYANIAMTHYYDVWFQWTDDRERSVAEGLRGGQRAVALDEAEPMAHIALAVGYSFTGPADRLVAGLDRALELDPSSALALGYWGGNVGPAGRAEEGVAAVERALRLSPRDPLIWRHWDHMTYAAFATEDYELVIESAENVLRAQPDYVYSHIMAGASAARLGRSTEATARVERALDVQPDLSLAFVESVFGFATEEYKTRLLGALREAGMPES